VAKSLPQRRRFLSACTVGLLALLGGLIVGPVVAFVTNPLRKKPGTPDSDTDYADAGPIDALPTGQWKLVPIEFVRQDGWAKSRESRSVWVKKSGSDTNDIRVLSPICTHLGCPIAWSSDSSQFRCPCHGGTFSDSGTQIAGPPPRGMDPLDFQVRDGHLWIRWEDFKISVPDRVRVQV
jgi:menaquinol-cytochrome c reductase iron-sulfur subunit